MKKLQLYEHQNDRAWIAHDVARSSGFRPVSDSIYMVQCHCGKRYDVRQSRRITRHWLDHKHEHMNAHGGAEQPGERRMR